MANEMPASDGFTGLTRNVIRYSELFTGITAKAKAGPLTDADWVEIEALVDTDAFERVGVFLGPKVEVIGWAKYRHYIGLYAGATVWEGTLRDVTEIPGRVILELEERNIRDGQTDNSNTVTIYDFDPGGKLCHLDVYVMPLGK